ncbi:MAG: TRAP transporter small permease [Pseudomonadota bacterium]|nr:TRAP transporter small permease [Pseudomonadota bacterium]
MTTIFAAAAALRLALAWAAALLFVASGAMLTWEVCARYLFTAPTIWAAELSQLCLIWGSLIAMPWLLSARRHIAVDAVADRLPPGARAWTEAAAMAVVALFAGITAWYGWEIFLDSAMRGRTSGTMLDLKSWVAEAPVPLGCALLAAQAVAEMVKAFRTDWSVPRDGGGHA